MQFNTLMRGVIKNCNVMSSYGFLPYSDVKSLDKSYFFSEKCECKPFMLMDTIKHLVIPKS